MSTSITLKASAKLSRRVSKLFRTKTEAINVALYLTSQSFEFAISRIQSKFKARELRFIKAAFAKFKEEIILDTSRQELFHILRAHYSRPENQGMDNEHYQELIEKCENLDEFHYATLIVLVKTDRISELT